MEILLIKFAVPKSVSLSSGIKESIILQIPEGQVELKVTVNETILYRTYTLRSDDLKFKVSEDTIKRIWDSLYLLCIEMDLSILIDPGLIPFYIPKQRLKEMTKISKLDVGADFIGVKLLSSQALIIGSGPVSILCDSDINIFENLLSKYTNLNYIKSDRILRAIQIYNSSNYLTIVNYSARFILLISAIESLIEPDVVSKELSSFIDLTQTEVNKIDIDQKEKESFKGQLGNLKKASIRRAGLKLIEQLLDNSKKYNGYPPATFFDLAYDLRSKFVHEGRIKTESLDMKHNSLQTFTKDIITSYFNKICC
jgi:hypothetical protein